jgi:hypothetical protein
MVTRETTPRRLVARRGALGGEFHPSCRVHCTSTSQQGHRVTSQKTRDVRASALAVFSGRLFLSLSAFFSASSTVYIICISFLFS